MSVWLLPGQGAQKPGMGADLLDDATFAVVVQTMSEILDLDLARLMREGTQDELNDAFCAQAATMAVSVGVGRMLQERGMQPDAIVGFSLGQISALVLSDMLSLEDASRLLKVRASVMAQACEQKPGAMLALLGCDDTDVDAFCADVLAGLNAEDVAGDFVLVPANFNAPTQIVVSGSIDAIDAAELAWKALGKKSARLATAGAFHSPLMADAAKEVGAFCEGLTFQEPSCVVLCNTDAQPLSADAAATRLKKQVENGVKFSQSIEALAKAGHSDFIEVGYGKVLSGLVRKIDKSLTRKNVGNLQEFQAVFDIA